MYVYSLMHVINKMKQSKTPSNIRQNMYAFIVSAILFVLAFFRNVQCESSNRPKGCQVPLRTDAGWVCGQVRLAENKYAYASFRGVPYGKPPLGHRRFKELEPTEPWNGWRDATEESPACPTKELIYGRMYRPKKGQSEDCIYLNLHIPYLNSTTSRIPILVFIHGGGFHTGSGLTDVHGPEYLITKGVIVITFNYRLNVFGFLSLASKEIPGNQGLRDAVTLLRWVQRNARAFGGDPDNVTLMGQSAGATMAHILSISKVGQGLFKRLILMSGTAIENYYDPSPENTAIAKQFLSNLGINSTDSVFIHKQLTKLPLENIMESFTIILHNFGSTCFSPVVEGVYPGITRILEDYPSELLAQGKGKEYPLLLGYTNHEFEFFRWWNINFEMVKRVEHDHKLLLFPRLRLEVPEDVQTQLAQRVYDRCFEGNVTLDELIKCQSDFGVIYPTYKLAELRAKAGAPAYLYQYSYESERSLIEEGLWITYDGAAHVEDLTYVFRVNSLLDDHIVSFPPKNTDDRMKAWMTMFVTNFMRYSNPTCDKSESNWPRLSTKNFVYQNIAKPMVYQITKPTSDQVEMVKFYDSVDIKSRNATERLTERVRN